jgi:hypothetical protein
LASAGTINFLIFKFRVFSILLHPIMTVFPKIGSYKQVKFHGWFLIPAHWKKMVFFKIVLSHQNRIEIHQFFTNTWKWFFF